MNVRYNLINGVSWFRGKDGRIFNFKQSLLREKSNLPFFVYSPWILVIRDPDLFLVIRVPDLFLAEIFHERSLRLY
ncbi:hypothetical protein H5410_049545 [Solanum commersonii]|uniref:Uncharacterized protein n=1 Tax=Solanum commersonii TaxID=4109 RepID=A0A9J5WVD8_SOLCO|nr:hypothetical protein H5410_049545 [Solanum commersonii]